MNANNNNNNNNNNNREGQQKQHRSLFPSFNTFLTPIKKPSAEEEQSLPR